MGEGHPNVTISTCNTCRISQFHTDFLELPGHDEKLPNLLVKYMGEQSDMFRVYK